MCIEPFFFGQSSSTTNIYNMEPDLRGYYCNSCNTAMTPNELAEVRERYSNEKFPGLDMPMDQV